MIRTVIDAAHKAGAKVGLCGQAPSDHPEFAEFLVDCGIDFVSVAPDSFLSVKHTSPPRNLGVNLPQRLQPEASHGIARSHQWAPIRPRLY
jgi:hypothetical protein